jgi:protein ImuB
VNAPVRTLVVSCPDWPVIATGSSADEPVAVIRANRVTATSPAARHDGVEVGQRRREAQRRCPSLAVIDPDPDRDARVFGSVVTVLDRVTPRIELSRPGRIAFPTIGPSRYFGGDTALAELVVGEIDGVLSATGWFDAVGVGIADGPFAAEHAAAMAKVTGSRVHVVAPGASGSFLAPFPVGVLDRPELADVLRRLGLGTLGAFASLDIDDVVARFGSDGRAAHRLALGLDDRPPDVGPPPRSFDVSVELDPPAERVDIVAFAARALADGLHERLSGDGLACTRVLISAETEHGERLERVWRHEGALSASAIVDRVRWQLDGWLNGPTVRRPSSGVVRLVLVPDEVAAARGRQQGFWGGESEADERAGRALARVQGMLGASAVTVPEERGGRGPADRIVRVAFTARDGTAGRAPGPVDAPWPGRIPAPAPALLPVSPVPVMVLDASGAVVSVSGRGAISADPSRVVLGDDSRVGASVGPSIGPSIDIASWAGPWPSDERWWDPDSHRRRARLQLVLADGRAVLVHLEQGRWSIEGVHD